MKIEYFKTKTIWREVADAARTTINMSSGIKEPPSSWKKKMLLAEHSPIRLLVYRWKWVDLKYWVSVHFVRHKIGVEHFVGTQRTDRTGVNRDGLTQSSTVTHECIANAQAIINISRKRLCRNASKESTEAWKAVLEGVKKQNPILFNVCVPECVYRGFCPEIKSCGFTKTEQYGKNKKHYRKI